MTQGRCHAPGSWSFLSVLSIHDTIVPRYNYLQGATSAIRRHDRADPPTRRRKLRGTPARGPRRDGCIALPALRTMRAPRCGPTRRRSSHVSVLPPRPPHAPCTHIATPHPGTDPVSEHMSTRTEEPSRHERDDTAHDDCQRSRFAAAAGPLCRPRRSRETPSGHQMTGDADQTVHRRTPARGPVDTGLECTFAAERPSSFRSADSCIAEDGPTPSRKERKRQTSASQTQGRSQGEYGPNT